MQFDIEAARKSGATDEQIAQYLSQQRGGFDLDGALKAGATHKQVAEFLTNDLKREPLPEGVEPSTSGPGRGIAILNAKKPAGFSPSGTNAPGLQSATRKRGGLASEFSPFVGGDAPATAGAGRGRINPGKPACISARGADHRATPGAPGAGLDAADRDERAGDGGRIGGA